MFASNEALSLLLLFKHIFVFKVFFLLVWPDQFVRFILLFGW